MMKLIVSVAIVLAGLYQPVYAEEPDPFKGRLLPLELVMSFRKDIDLTKQQNKDIGALVVDLQKSVAEKQWQMQAAYFDLIEELDEETIDEARTLELVDTAIGTENEIKLEQIRFLIRIRNLLDETQIAYLRQKLDEGWTEE